MENNKLICPFCQQELQEDVGYDGDYSCPNCKEPYFGSPELWQELIRTRKENEDKQAVLNCVVDMLKTLNQKYTLIMGKDVIKETVRLLEQTKGGDNE